MKIPLFSRRPFLLPWLGIGLLSLLPACRKDLCYDHDAHTPTVKVQAQFTWEREWERPYEHHWEASWPLSWETSYDELRPQIAQGVRALAYHSSGVHAESNLPPDSGRVPLQEGTSELLFYNNDTEYIVFINLGKLPEATATTRSVSRGGFHALHPNERTMNPPDMLYGHYEAEYVAERTLQPIPLRVQMQPLVYTYHIRYEFSRGQQYIALARGALAGMAERVYLTDGHTGDAASTLLFEASVEDYGAEASVKTFGVPNYPGDPSSRADGSPARFTLNLEVRLTNGKFKNFNVDVTDQVLEQPRGGLLVVDDLVITDEEGKQPSGGGGFDVEVEGWGDQIDIPLPL